MKSVGGVWSGGTRKDKLLAGQDTGYVQGGSQSVAEKKEKFNLLLIAYDHFILTSPSSDFTKNFMKDLLQCHL